MSTATSTATTSVAPGRPARARRPASRHDLTRGAALGLGVNMIWFSLLVLIPLQLSIIGFYHYMSKLGLTDNYASLILPVMASAARKGQCRGHRFLGLPLRM